MCDFVSWIDIKGMIYFLTDAEIFSDLGREKLSGCKDNDFLGHGAIRRFYDLKDKGVDRENKNFWEEVSNIPEIIRSKLQNFDHNWGKTFEEYFQNDDLRYIIEYAPDEWKSKAWEQLLKQSPSNSDLRYIIEYAPDEWKKKAWEQLLKQSPSNDDLRYIIRYAPDEWKSKAWEQLRN
jgi:hypothetical protein